MTAEEYLAWEAEQDTKRDFWDGEVFEVRAMAGGTAHHALLSADAVAALHAARPPAGS